MRASLWHIPHHQSFHLPQLLRLRWWRHDLLPSRLHQYFLYSLDYIIVIPVICMCFTYRMRLISAQKRVVDSHVKSFVEQFSVLGTMTISPASDCQFRLSRQCLGNQFVLVSPWGTYDYHVIHTQSPCSICRYPYNNRVVLRNMYFLQV